MTSGPRSEKGKKVGSQHMLPVLASTELAIPESGSEENLNMTIARLFDNPFQIDRILEHGSFDLTRRELDGVDNVRQWLTFFLGGEEYAINIEVVNEIIKPREITDIPRVPDYVLGIVSLRGIILPVYDLARRLGLGSVDNQQPNRIIVCQREDRLAGLLVDSIRQVVRLHETKIESTPAVLSGPGRDFISGVGRHQGRMLILLQLENIFNPEVAWQQERSFR